MNNVPRWSQPSSRQYTLDGQSCSYEFCRGITVGKQDRIFVFCPICRNTTADPSSSRTRFR